MASTTQQKTNKRVEIDFMFLDLEVCTRCRNTDSNLEAALDTVRSVLQSAGVELLVRKNLVDSEQKAMELGFISSPTIRVNGRDIALEFRESSCASCGEACACEGNIDCRVWVYQGQEYTAAPAPMIVDAILAAVYGTMEAAPASVQVPPVLWPLTWVTPFGIYTCANRYR
jgi:MoaA/NifB/PqqE/SkfB family radical SAM enzyme